jgi:hypothetical protein
MSMTLASIPYEREGEEIGLGGIGETSGGGESD